MFEPIMIQHDKTRVDAQAIMSLVIEVGDYLATHQRSYSKRVIPCVKEDLVTEADMISCKLLQERLQETTGVQAVYSEEDAVEKWSKVLDQPPQDYWFIIDPLDGTETYAANKAGFGVQVALLKHNTVVGSWLYCPPNRMAFALFDYYCGPAAIDSSSRASISAVVADGDFFGEDYVRLNPWFCQIDSRVKLPSCANDYLSFLSGDVDALFYKRSFPWDHLAGTFLAKKVGAVVHSFSNAEIKYNDWNSGVIVFNPRRLTVATNFK